MDYCLGNCNNCCFFSPNLCCTYGINILVVLSLSVINLFLSQFALVRWTDLLISRIGLHLAGVISCSSGEVFEVTITPLRAR